MIKNKYLRIYRTENKHPRSCADRDLLYIIKADSHEGLCP